MSHNEADFRRVGDVFCTHDGKRFYTVLKDCGTSVMYVRCDRRGQLLPFVPFWRRFDLRRWTYFSGPTAQRIIASPVVPIGPVDCSDVRISFGGYEVTV